MSRIFLVTGASRGIGRALLEELAARGHKIIGIGRSKSPVGELPISTHQNICFEQADVSDFAGLKLAIKRGISNFGVPDTVICNAAVCPVKQFTWDTRTDDLNEAMAINLGGISNTVKAVAPAMIKNQCGIIVGVSSKWGTIGVDGFSSYVASKWAVEGYMRCLAKELQEITGMAAVIWDPGSIDTELLRSAIGLKAARFPTPQEWAPLVVPELLALTPQNNGSKLCSLTNKRG